jgi:hypothetical protein
MSSYSIRSKASFESVSSESSQSTVISVPDRLPPTVDGPSVWRGTDLGTNDYVVYLSAADVEAVRAAVISFKCRTAGSVLTESL